MMKLLFIQLSFHPDYPDSSTLATTYNDGIYYVASFAMENFPGAQVDICQMMWGEKITSFDVGAYDYLLISALATHFWANLEVLQHITATKSKNCKVIMGGPHPAFAPWEALKYADYVIQGEGEIPLVQLLEVLENGGDITSVNNLCYVNETGNLVMNHLHRYNTFTGSINTQLLQRAPKLHWATVSMSRGCPFNCSFCYAIRILGRRFRTKDAADVRRELDAINKQTGCSRFYVTDLNFTTKKDFCHEVANVVRDAQYHFIAMTRIDLADDVELLLDLKDAGFHEYCLGVESEDPEVLSAFNKKVDAGQQTQRLLTFAEHDINVHSAIIYGLPNQDMTAIHRTAKWCADARIVHPTFVCLAEYPFQNLLFGSRQDIEDHLIIQGSTHLPALQFCRYFSPPHATQPVATGYYRELPDFL
jgi:anaerobic magnesium-protoporphyrin IX monomethyl ester cyclase